MAENNGTNGGGASHPGDSSLAPQVNVLGQSVKDLSFESPILSASSRGRATIRTCN